jgi:hypothetical protein
MTRRKSSSDRVAVYLGPQYEERASTSLIRVWPHETPPAATFAAELNKHLRWCLHLDRCKQGSGLVTSHRTGMTLSSTRPYFESAILMVLCWKNEKELLRLSKKWNLGCVASW